MSTKTAVPTLWHMPNDLWSRLAPLLGPEKAPGTPGRPAVSFRLLFDALLYVLRTGCQRRAIPRQEDAPGATVHGRFRQWVKAGVFAQAWKVLLEYYDQEVGIAWQWQALDGAITKAPLGGEATGPSPVDRAKSGTKRSVLTDRRGAPLAVVVTGAMELVIAHVKTRPNATLLYLGHPRKPGNAGGFYQKLGFEYTGNEEEGGDVEMRLVL